MKCAKKEALDECEETARTCTEMASNKCSDYIPTTSTMKCAKKDGTGKCELVQKDCNEFDVGSCSLFESADLLTSCLPDRSNDGCVPKTCKLENKDNCNNYTPLTSTKKCALNVGGSECEEQDRTCEEMEPEKCGDFVPSDSLTSCVKNTTTGQCGILACSLMQTDKCNEYTPSTSTKKCILKSGATKCEEENRTCEEMSNEKCGDFIPSDNTKKCELNTGSNKCVEIKKEENKTGDDSTTEGNEQSNGNKSNYIQISVYMIVLLMSLL
jgi:hypothetical protein